MTNFDMTSGYVGTREVQKILLGTGVVWPTIDYSQIPLTFEIISGGTINWVKGSGYLAPEQITIQYKLNDGSWKDISATTAGTQIAVSAGDIIEFRGNLTRYGETDASRYRNFSGSTAVFEIKGNIMSMANSSGYASATTLVSDRSFEGLFRDCTGLTSAEHLVLPADILTDSCYRRLFYNCSSLEKAPELPATTLANYCYSSMFYNCASLTTAPVLPASVLAENCYNGMFQDCASLNYVKCLATDITATDSVRYWFFRASETGTFVKHPDTTWPSGISGIPTGWTIENATI